MNKPDSNFVSNHRNQASLLNNACDDLYTINTNYISQTMTYMKECGQNKFSADVHQRAHDIKVELEGKIGELEKVMNNIPVVAQKYYNIDVANYYKYLK